MLHDSVLDLIILCPKNLRFKPIEVRSRKLYVTLRYVNVSLSRLN